MKTINKLGLGVMAVTMSLSACTKDFENLNRDPEVSPSVLPELLITSPEKSIVDRDFDWFYDNYQYLMRWMQFTVASPSSSSSGLFRPTNVNDFYNAFYGSNKDHNIGRNLQEILNLVAKMPEEARSRYRHIAAIAQVLKVYAAWRVSDANGSIPYSQALMARDSTPVFTPVYDNQQTLFGTWDAELKGAIATLAQDLPDQTTYGSGDIYYGGDRVKWAKAANVLRLKIAMRLIKRDPAKVRAVAQEVLASPAGLFASNEEELKFVSADNQFAKSGNWNPENNPFVAAKNMIDFMYDKQDPRLRLFYKKNDYTPQVIDSLKKGGGLPADAVYNPRQYVGLPSSPDASKNARYAPLFSEKNYRLKSGNATITATFDTLSEVQKRLFDLDRDNITGGQYTQPLLTYAEMCLMLSELSVRGMITEDAVLWYNKGVTASIKAYDRMGAIAKIVGYQAVTDAEIATYLSQPGIALNGSRDEQLEKLGIQYLLNHFKSPWEAWGSYKRLDVPREGGILPLEPFYSSNIRQAIPRRWALPLPDRANQSNYNKALQEMMQTGEYGNSADDITGRVWWDKK